ncbi:MAG: hypothetical protein O3A87_03605 [Verrucomicrobia bacterium]|nr:hypothetical protein [Verrucomicrobiota bacterium]MDA1005549.1 hypothetical protein [Verrucomicrobiota bacterium]
MSIPKRLFPLLAILALSPSLPAQDEPAPAEPIPAWMQAFENLPREQKEAYGKAISEGGRLFNQKRIFEALNAVYEAEEILKQNPAALSLKGACYVEFRDFPRARACFDEALALSPKNPNVLFNLVEMDFVTQMWKDCQRRIKELTPLVDPRNIPMLRLLEFKLLLTYLKTNELEEARALATKYDFLDDNPYYYYANAAMMFHAENPEEAEAWIARARRVFQNDADLAPWEDTLIEYGYIKSFYGEDLNPDAAAAPQP